MSDGSDARGGGQALHSRALHRLLCARELSDAEGSALICLLFPVGLAMQVLACFNAEFNLERAQSQKDGFEATAARLERSGKELDASLISNIERSQVQVKSLETEIVQRRQEQSEAKERFARDRALFRQEICVEQTAISAVTEAN